MGIGRRYDMGKYCGNHWQFMIGKVFGETKKEAFIDRPKISRVSRVTMCQYTLKQWKFNSTKYKTPAYPN